MTGRSILNAVVMMSQGKMAGNVPESEITMTSLQIVKWINDERAQIALDGGKRFIKLEHKSFLTKVPSVLGEEGQQNFLHTHTNPQNGQQYPMYTFPKREASLLAMSYSYTIQAQVWDHMTRLEDELKQRTGSSMVGVPTTFVEALRLAADNMEKWSVCCHELRSPLPLST